MKSRGCIRPFMREDICTIPVNEVMEVKDGCPICRMFDTLEDHMLSFIMGDAMMEPDVRIKTNEVGFCARHFSMMLGRKNRLSLALMLESHLAEIENNVFEKEGFFSRSPKKEEKADALHDGCYVCERVETELDRLLVTFFKLWKKEAEFRENVAAQPIFCLPHYALLLKKGRQSLDKKEFAAFESVISGITKTGILSLKDDVTGFCKMFDYRNSSAEWGNSRDAIERSIAFLTGYKK